MAAIVPSPRPLYLVGDARSLVRHVAGVRSRMLVKVCRPLIVDNVELAS
jgi:hypothetical protein